MNFPECRNAMNASSTLPIVWCCCESGAWNSLCFTNRVFRRDFTFACVCLTYTRPNHYLLRAQSEFLELLWQGIASFLVLIWELYPHLMHTVEHLTWCLLFITSLWVGLGSSFLWHHNNTYTQTLPLQHIQEVHTAFNQYQVKSQVNTIYHCFPRAQLSLESKNWSLTVMEESFSHQKMTIASLCPRELYLRG